ncbi:MAG: hypothetical protein HY550_01655 [Elusimicrobia bacterium]|nr:hypothetical protein [Elusimicrobiota bacterium]
MKHALEFKLIHRNRLGQTTTEFVLFLAICAGGALVLFSLFFGYTPDLFSGIGNAITGVCDTPGAGEETGKNDNKSKKPGKEKPENNSDMGKQPDSKSGMYGDPSKYASEEGYNYHMVFKDERTGKYYIPTNEQAKKWKENKEATSFYSDKPYIGPWSKNMGRKPEIEGFDGDKMVAGGGREYTTSQWNARLDAIKEEHYRQIGD